ncbi:MAG: hypothetical protein RML15_06490 [Bacteroidota bacterium]|nr:hypothetical protein [Candidatus Kapabacteria bacterium]MDW8272040.1 hypothetical protein [Bacteroidota bacterium]
MGLSPTLAQRIVDIQLNTLGKADICGDRQVVVTVDVSSPLFTSDSLLLFEVALRYDPQKLQFIAPLFSGTLTENTEYRGSGAIDSTIIRIWAFNVMRPIYGNGRPLVAALFRYRGNCPDTAAVTIAYTPEKNQEAKIVFGQLGSTVVEAIEQQNRQRSLKAQFPIRSVSIPLRERKKIQCVFSVGQGTRVQQWRWTATIPANLEVESVRLPYEDSLQLFLEERTANTLRGRIVSPSPIRERQVVTEWTVLLTEGDTAVVQVEVEQPSCGCVGAVSGDTVTIVRQEISAVPVYNWPIPEWIWKESYWELRDQLEQVAEVTVWDITGRVLLHTQSSGNGLYRVERCRWCVATVRLHDNSRLRTMLIESAASVRK